MENSPNFIPSNIAYHFKTNFATKKVQQNYRTDDQWNDEITEENTWALGPGEEFVLTFFFNDDEIIVYSEDEYRNYQYSIKNRFAIGEIKSVQVWDGVQYINEIIFRYKK